MDTKLSLSTIHEQIVSLNSQSSIIHQDVETLRSDVNSLIVSPTRPSFALTPFDDEVSPSNLARSSCWLAAHSTTPSYKEICVYSIKWDELTICGNSAGASTLQAMKMIRSLSHITQPMLVLIHWRRSECTKVAMLTRWGNILPYYPVCSQSPAVLAPWSWGLCKGQVWSLSPEWYI